jgi:hypothetical protein
VTVSSVNDGGSVTTPELTYSVGNAPTAGVLQAYLNNLGSLYASPMLNGNVQVIGPAGGPFYIIYSNSLANKDSSLLTLAASGTANVTVATLANGGVISSTAANEVQYIALASNSEVQTIWFANTTTGGSFSLTFAG